MRTAKVLAAQARRGRQRWASTRHKTIALMISSWPTTKRLQPMSRKSLPNHIHTGTHLHIYIYYVYVWVDCGSPTPLRECSMNPIWNGKGLSYWTSFPLMVSLKDSCQMNLSCSSMRDGGVLKALWLLTLVNVSQPLILSSHYETVKWLEDILTCSGFVINRSFHGLFWWG